MLGVLNVLYANVARGKYFGHMRPSFVKYFVRIVDSDLIQWSACND